MALAAFKEKRLTHRKRLTGLLPGRLTIAGLKANINFRPIDISPHGLGIILQYEISTGVAAVLHCTIEGRARDIQLTVAWIKHDFGKQDMFRVGLVTIDPKDDLERIFEMTGCLK